MTTKEFEFNQKINQVGTCGRKKAMQLIYEWIKMDKIDMEEYEQLITFIKG